MGVWIETLTFYGIIQFRRVTPCVGVWIETVRVALASIKPLSHPAWVCGLKQKIQSGADATKLMVTPCVGVWIETKVFE